MRQKSVAAESASERIVKTIRRATRKHYSAEEKIRIVLDGLRGESSIAELCRRESIAESLYYTWSKEFLEAGKRRLAGDTARAATSGEVKDLRPASAFSVLRGLLKGGGNRVEARPAVVAHQRPPLAPSIVRSDNERLRDRDCSATRVALEADRADGENDSNARSLRAQSRPQHQPPLIAV